MQSAIPLTVIGGYLGSGKTTLLNALLRQPHGKRFALLVNDFGSINIDAGLIENQQGETINLANGCICCSLAAGFVVALNTVLNLQSRPDQVIIEASGVADPRKIANYGNTPGTTATHRAFRCKAFWWLWMQRASRINPEINMWGGRSSSRSRQPTC